MIDNHTVRCDNCNRQIAQRCACIVVIAPTVPAETALCHRCDEELEAQLPQFLADNPPPEDRRAGGPQPGPSADTARLAYDMLVEEALALGLDGGLTLLSLVLTFGWAGSPGEWTPWGDAVATVHSAHRPEEEATNGPFLFHSYILMDDLVLVEPSLGLRPWISRTAAEQAIARLLGPAAVNQEKKEFEGSFSPVKLVWGLEYRTLVDQVAIPEHRLLKGAYLLNEPCYDSGNKTTTLHDVQVLRGVGPAG